MDDEKCCLFEITAKMNTFQRIYFEERVLPELMNVLESHLDMLRFFGEE